MGRRHEKMRRSQTGDDSKEEGPLCCRLRDAEEVQTPVPFLLSRCLRHQGD